MWMPSAGVKMKEWDHPGWSSQRTENHGHTNTCAPPNERTSAGAYPRHPRPGNGPAPSEGEKVKPALARPTRGKLPSKEREQSVIQATAQCTLTASHEINQTPRLHHPKANHRDGDQGGRWGWEGGRDLGTDTALHAGQHHTVNSTTWLGEPGTERRLTGDLTGQRVYNAPSGRGQEERSCPK